MRRIGWRLVDADAMHNLLIGTAQQTYYFSYIWFHSHNFIRFNRWRNELQCYSTFCHMPDYEFEKIVNIYGVFLDCERGKLTMIYCRYLLAIRVIKWLSPPWRCNSEYYSVALRFGCKKNVMLSEYVLDICRIVKSSQVRAYNS